MIKKIVILCVYVLAVGSVHSATVKTTDEILSGIVPAELLTLLEPQQKEWAYQTYDNCKTDRVLRRRFDCECIAGKAAEIQLEMKLTSLQQVIGTSANDACINPEKIAEDKWFFCMSDPHFIESPLKTLDEFCDCFRTNIQRSVESRRSVRYSNSDASHDAINAAEVCR